MAFPSTLEPDPKQAIALLEALFPLGSVIHFRSVPEPKDGRDAVNHFYERNAHFANTVSDFLSYCAIDRRAAFYLPAVVPAGKAGKNDVTAIPTVLVDLDKGDTTANLAELEKTLGPATAIIESGGTTDAGTPKLHVYHALETAATGADVEIACKVRETLAQRHGGDPAFKQSGQVVRLPGSLHLKTEPKLVQLRSLTTNRYQLPAIVSALGITRKAPAADNFFDFNTATPQQNDGLDRALTAPIHSEGKDGITRFEGASKALGHFIRMVRDGRMTDEEGWRAACEWNSATLVPPWPEDRLRTDYERLRDIDLKQHGPIAQPAIASQAIGDTWTYKDFPVDRFKGEPPARKWIVEGVIPAGTVGVLASVGGAGKSLLLLKLALDVATLPPLSAGLAFPPRFFGGDVVARGGVVMFTAEDDEIELHHRLRNLDPQRYRDGKQFHLVSMPSVGLQPIVVASGKQLLITPFWERQRAALLADKNLKLIIVDPLQSFFGSDTNDNAHAAQFMGLLAEISSKTGAAVIVSHHFGKSEPPANLNEARNLIRGAGAFTDNARWAIAMWEPDPNGDFAYETLKALGQESRLKPGSVSLVFKGGLVKANAPGERNEVTMVRNGDTGLLENVTAQLRAATPRKDETDDAVYKALSAIKLAEPAFKFAASVSALDRSGTHRHVARTLDISKAKLAASIERLIANGLVVRTSDKGPTAYYEPKMD